LIFKDILIVPKWTSKIGVFSGELGIRI